MINSISAKKGRNYMAKVFTIHTMELREGVSEEDFEKLFLEKLVQAWSKLGWKGHILKGNRGQRKGKYAAIWEIPNVEARDRIFPEEGKDRSEEAARLLGPEFDALLQKMDTFTVDWNFTDYVEQSK
jgi:hypothetical protein